LAGAHVLRDAVAFAMLASMDFSKFQFGKLNIDGITYERDLIIDRGRIRKRKKKLSKKFRHEFGHTPVSIEERIPWKCRRLVIGTGRYGSLPVMSEVKKEAHRRRIDLLILPTDEALEALAKNPDHTNAILHVTC
jgi:hypothetical protein